ncbi:MAG: GntR family transcriptional regulator [Anaerolineales bacterium]|nr:GntR family transcriptional regulator [Anaerolineales bacterium]
MRGEWQPDDILPSEIELMEQYSVSRITVRQALDELVNEGLIYRQRGRGTFVAHPTVEQGLTRIISFTEDMRQRGFTPGTEVLFAGLEPATPEVAAQLQLEPGVELVRLERLRLADNEPMSIEEFAPGASRLPRHFAARLRRPAPPRNPGANLQSPIGAGQTNHSRHRRPPQSGRQAGYPGQHPPPLHRTDFLFPAKYPD